MRKSALSMLLCILLMVERSKLPPNSEEMGRPIEETNKGLKGILENIKAPRQDIEINEDRNIINFEFFPCFPDYEYTDEMYEILGGCLIYSEEDWIDYKQKFCIAAGPYTTPDFNEKCFLALPSLYGSRPSANSSFVVDSIEVVNNGLYVQIAESTPENTIYVENSNGVDHLFVNVIVLNRSDIPEDVETKIYVR